MMVWCGEVSYVVQLCNQQLLLLELIAIPASGVMNVSCASQQVSLLSRWFERQVPGYPRYSYAGDPSLGQHHLVISGITITEDGEYQCQVGPTQTNPPIWASANVTVLVAPTGINIVGWEDGAVVEVMAGASLTLECLVTDARPVASIMWHKDALMPDPRFVQERVEASSLPRRWTIRSRLAVTAVAEDDGKLYTCEADHPTLRESSHPLMASIILSVLLSPPATRLYLARSDQQYQRAGDAAVPGEAAHKSLILVNKSEVMCKERKSKMVIEQKSAGAAHNDSHSPTDRPGPPIISGYKTGEVLVAGERRTLVCRVSGGNPRPWVTWHRQGLLLDDTTTADATGVINTLQLIANAADDGVIYECRVSSDLLQKPLVANVSLTVYYAPSSVSVSGPAQVQEGVVVSLTCETSESNPPASLTWLVNGEQVDSTREIMSRVSTGGWATSSELTHLVARSTKDTQIKVECRAINPSIKEHVTKTILMAITKPAGPPEFEGDPHKEVVAGTMVELTCNSWGGQPPPTVRFNVFMCSKIEALTSSRNPVIPTPSLCPLSRNSPVWVAKPPPEIDVYEGDDLVVNAQAAANPGPARYCDPPSYSHLLVTRCDPTRDLPGNVTHLVTPTA
ncbi:Nephrin-like 8 [Homarus americanus]|uniref:Nephrin-like 8 n=1 Tax=Homarus americanus TaxID=6706 RepID=A0A8J5JPD6_HOMAM|nr:Nephrin-like 8 [Homarus americanus]